MSISRVWCRWYTILDWALPVYTRFGGLDPISRWQHQKSKTVQVGNVFNWQQNQASLYDQCSSGQPLHDKLCSVFVVQTSYLDLILFLRWHWYQKASNWKLYFLFKFTSHWLMLERFNLKVVFSRYVLMWFELKLCTVVVTLLCLHVKRVINVCPVCVISFGTWWRLFNWQMCMITCVDF